MANYNTYIKFITFTISNDLVHILMIILEYIFCIYPSCFNSSLKIQLVEFKPDVYGKTPNMNIINILTFIHWDHPSYLVNQILFGITCAFLIIYYAMVFSFNYGMNSSGKVNYLLSILINFYDLIFFRYWSILFIDSCVSLSLSYGKIGTFKSGIYSYLFIATLIIYLASAFHFIKSNFVILNIMNPLLVTEDKKYPYDVISMEYDTMALLIKVIIAFEYNSSMIHIDINYLIYFWNLLIFAVSFVIFIRMALINSFLKFHYSLLYANTGKNLLRKYIAIFNFILTCFVIIGYSDGDTYITILGYIFFSLCIVILLFAFEYHYSNFYIKKYTALAYDIILLMMLMNSKKQKEQVKLIQDCLFFKHIKKCQEVKCLLCMQYSDDTNKNISIFFNYLSMITPDKIDYDKLEGKTKEKQYKDIIILFNYQLNNNILMCLFYYSGLNKQYQMRDPKFVNNLKLIVFEWLNKGNVSQDKFMEMIFGFSNLEKLMKGLFEEFIEFINEKIELKQNLTALSLSRKLKGMIYAFKKVSDNNNLKDEMYAHDNTVKLTNSIFKYNLTVLRHTIQSLINQELSGLPRLDIELLDEYLNTHFTQDNLLIMSIDLNISNSHINIIKVTGELSNENPQVLTDCFPARIKQKLMKVFLKKLQNPKNKAVVNSLSTLYIPFKYKRVLHFMKYSYHFSDIMNSNSVIIYGYYTKEQKNCVILDFKNKKNEILIVDSSKEFYRLLKYRPVWVQYFNSLNFTFSLSTLFKEYKNQGDNIECKIDYNYLINNSNKLFSQLSSMVEFQDNPKYLRQIKSSNDKYKKLKNKIVMITLERIEVIEEGYFYLYQVNSKTRFDTSIVANLQSIQKECENTHFLKYNTINLSNTSMTQDYSRCSLNLPKKNKKSEFQIANFELKNQIAMKTRNLSIFSFTMIILSLTLIVICTVYLITQIIKTNELTRANDCFFQYKTLRLSIANFCMSFAVTICIATNTTEVNCVNQYEKFSNKFQKEYNLPNDLNFVEYLISELKFKAIYTQNLITQIQSEFHVTGNRKYIEVLDNPMSYFVFFKSDKEILLTTVQVPFQEGLRRYINSIYVIIENGMEMSSVPMYFLTYSNGTYLFDNIINNTLTTIQQEIYQELINYFNFAVSFNKGETSLREILNSIQKQNTIINSLFMIVIATLNLLLMILCICNINTAYSLFKVLISNVIDQIGNKDNSNYFMDKLRNLQILSRLYFKNPNDIILRLNKDRKEYLALKLEKNKLNKYSPVNGYPQEEMINDHINRKIHFGSNFYYSVVLIYFVAFAIVFGIYFLTIIALDIAVNLYYTKLFDIFEYVYLQYNHENALFVNISLAHLVALLNITEADLANFLNKPNPDDGLLNFLIRDSFDKYYELFRFKTNNDLVSFPSLSSYVVYNCDNIFDAIHDTYIRSASADLNKDYLPMPIIICKAYDLLNLGGFNYLLLDMEQRTQLLMNNRIGNDYKSLVQFSTGQSLFEVYTIGLLFYRPLSTFFRNEILLPTLKNSFDNYVALTGGYLCINFMLEVVIFAVIKWFIILKLEGIQSDLYLLNNCVN